MPGQDDSGQPATRTGADREEQPRPSRRSVLQGAAGVGIAGIAATALAGAAGPALAAARPAAPGPKAGEANTETTTDQVVVHVRDAGSGEIDVFRGTSHVRVHDPELAARLVRASR
jgi:hypothetical protein